MGILKYKRAFILIVCGISLCLAFIIVTIALHIYPDYNNVEVAIGVLTPMPAYIGLFIYSRKIKEQKRGSSYIITRIAFILVASSLITSIFAILRAIGLIN